MWWCKCYDIIVAIITNKICATGHRTDTSKSALGATPQPDIHNIVQTKTPQEPRHSQMFTMHAKWYDRNTGTSGDRPRNLLPSHFSESHTQHYGGTNVAGRMSFKCTNKQNGGNIMVVSGCCWGHYNSTTIPQFVVCGRAQSRRRMDCCVCYQRMASDLHFAKWFTVAVHVKLATVYPL